MKKVSAIICAYNEEKSVKDVILSISKTSIIDELIVINDGSIDNTKKIIEDLKESIELIDVHFKENLGKGHAMAIGVEKANNEIIMFFDADLSNIKEDHFFRLINPITTKKADMVLGQPTETLINYNINPFKSFSGQRTLLKKDILPILSKMETSRFGVETLINLYYKSQGKTVKYIKLEGLIPI